MADNEKEFEKFVREIKFDDTPGPSHREKLEQELLRILAKQTTRRKEICRIIMKSPITKLAAAAVIIVAVLIGISTFNGTTAWAKVIKALGEVENIYIVSTMTMPDGTKVQSKWWLRKPEFLREESPSRIIIDNGKDRLTIDKEKKTAQFSDSLLPYEPLAEHYMFESIRLFRGTNPKGYRLAKLTHESTEEVIVYELKYKEQFEGKVWVQADTMLLLRVAATSIGEPKPDESKEGETIFDYAPISDDVFAMVIPEGFTELPRKQRGVMSGRVLDEQGHVVPGAVVYTVSKLRRLDAQDRTNEQGVFSFKLPPVDIKPVWFPVFLRAFVEDDPDQVAWTIIRHPDNKRELGGKIPGEVGQVKTVNLLQFGGAAGVVLRTEPAGKISGRVTDVEGNSIASAKVWVNSTPVDKFGNEVVDIGSLGETTQTDKQGRYELDNLPRFWDKTAFTFGVAADGYVREEKKFRTEGPLVFKQIDIRLFRAGLTVTGTVVDNYGELLEEREVYTRVNGKDYKACRARTDKQGRFRLAGCPMTRGLQIKAELSHYHGWGAPGVTKERRKKYRYYLDKVVDIDYEERKVEYEVEIVAERPQITIEVKLKNTAGELLPYFPVEVRGAPGSISSQWRADKKLDQRTDKRGYCRFTKVPNVESLRLVMWGGNSLFNDILSKEDARNIEDKYKKYKWTEVPIELIPGRKEYKVEVTILTNEEYEQKK